MIPLTISLFENTNMKDWYKGDTTTLLITLLTISTILWYLYIFFFKSKSQNLPQGPPGLPIFGNLLSLDPELHTYFAWLAQAHGPIFKLRLGSKYRGGKITKPNVIGLNLSPFCIGMSSPIPISTNPTYRDMLETFYLIHTESTNVSPVTSREGLLVYTIYNFLRVGFNQHVGPSKLFDQLYSKLYAQNFRHARVRRCLHRILSSDIDTSF
ncbi:putative N-methylcoclaurine 3'-monooxygenase [Medicago truncatula]|uniref:Putative N-methylcoclaurine 3'-monooxygenase n=1 Tax=Medicago truncatula TaxID=3880 RepID=A0A396IK45_MEDTR|nr:putative N-methylcoclaurine 3'-monooxygenase [Medicago truncatula]